MNDQAPMPKARPKQPQGPLGHWPLRPPSLGGSPRPTSYSLDTVGSNKSVGAGFGNPCWVARTIGSCNLVFRTEHKIGPRLWTVQATLPALPRDVLCGTWEGDDCVSPFGNTLEENRSPRSHFLCFALQTSKSLIPDIIILSVKSVIRGQRLLRNSRTSLARSLARGWRCCRYTFWEMNSLRRPRMSQSG